MISEATPQSPQPFGKYLLLKRLAVGGMAELYLARDPDAQRMVVIKRILPYLAQQTEFVQMFLDEARIAAQLNHPNIIQVFELGSLEGAIFLAMEYVEGADLRKILQEELRIRSAVPPKIAASLAASLCAGLDYAHRRVGADGQPLGIIHRDISPQNLMVGFKGEVKLVDFGIAKANAFMERSQPGVIKGKFLYLSPEQLSHTRIDHRADIFAVGTMLYEIITGKSPFFKPTSEGVIYAIRIEEPPAPHVVSRLVPPAVSKVVMRCLAKNPDDRYQRAGEIQADLEAYLATVGFDPYEVRDYVSRMFPVEGDRTELFKGDAEFPGPAEEKTFRPVATPVPTMPETPIPEEEGPPPGISAHEKQTAPVHTNPVLAAHGVTASGQHRTSAIDAMPTTEQISLNDLGLLPTKMVTDVPADLQPGGEGPSMDATVQGTDPLTVPPKASTLPAEPATRPQRPSALLGGRSGASASSVPPVAVTRPLPDMGSVTDPSDVDDRLRDAMTAPQFHTVDITGHGSRSMPQRLRFMYARLLHSPWGMPILAGVTVLFCVLVWVAITHWFDSQQVTPEPPGPVPLQVRPAAPSLPSMQPTAVTAAPAAAVDAGPPAPMADTESDNRVKVTFAAPKDTVIQAMDGKSLSPNAAEYFVPGKHKVTFRCAGKHTVFTEFEVKPSAESLTVALRCPKK